MAGLSLKTVRKPLPADVQIAIVREEMVKALTPVAKQRASQRQALVSSWQPAHKPKFEAQVAVGPQRIFTRVVITNGSQSLGRYGGTVRDLWRWWNEGTRPHRILPRFKTILRFFVGSVAVFARMVQHPGTKGTGKAAEIDRRLNPQQNSATRRGFKNVWKRIKAENRRGRRR